MDKIVEYQIVSDVDPQSDMECAVRRQMEAGWVPYGGLCVSVPELGQRQYFQAMVKYAQPKPVDESVYEVTERSGAVSRITALSMTHAYVLAQHCYPDFINITAKGQKETNGK